MTDRDFVHRGFGGVAVPGDIAPMVLLVPAREEAAAIAAGWSGARLVADHYAWQAWTGDADGLPLTVCSTGTGSASAAIAIEELAILGARTLLALGATREPPDPLDVLVVAEGAMRFDAASHGYARPGFPAVPDAAVLLAVLEAARAARQTVTGAVVVDLDVDAEALDGSAHRSPTAEIARDVIRATGAVPVHGSPAVLMVAGTVHGLRTGFLAAADAPDAQARVREVAAAALRRLAAEAG